MEPFANVPIHLILLENFPPCANFPIHMILLEKFPLVPSLARSVPKPLKVPSLARSVPKLLKVPSLARSVPKPCVGEVGGLQTRHCR